MCDVSDDACAPHPFKIPMKIVDRAMNNCYLGDGTVHPGDHFSLYMNYASCSSVQYFDEPS
jgi:hypothetical protein